MEQLCILTAQRDNYSETFIRAHLEHLVPGIILGLQDVPFEISSLKKIQGHDRISLVKQQIAQYWLNPTRLWKAQKRLRQQGTKVIMGEFGHQAARALPLAQKLDLPLVAHFHGADAHRTDILGIYQQAYQAMFAYSKFWAVAVSTTMRQQLIELGAPAERIFHNVYGCQVEKFQPNPQAPFRTDFLFVGRLTPKKAPYLTLLAFHQILQRYPQATLEMVGDGELWEVCHRLIHSLNMSHAVRLRKAVPHEEVRSLMQGAKAFVLHSVRAFNGDCEGTPNVILEAMATGLPIIATSHAGIADVVEEGQTGYLVDEGDLQAMSQAMERVLEAPETHQGMGQQGRKRVETSYRMEQSIERLERFLEQVAKDPNPI